MHLRPFEIALIGIFAAAAIGSLIFVSVYKGGAKDAIRPYGEKVTIWGTLNGYRFNDVFSEIRTSDKEFSVVEYIQKDPNTFDAELVDAIAEGVPPDLIVLPHERLAFFRTKLMPISYATVSERFYRDTYVDGAEIFMRSEGIYGIPFAVDPLVLYWNRDMFASNGLATPPRTWEQLTDEAVKSLTKKDIEFNISESAVSLGEYSNISYPKKILSMLFLQAGSSLVTETGGKYEVTMNDKTASGLPPGDAVLSFYTQFANPTNDNYSWNRSLRGDRLMFLAGELGMYFAPGSEFEGLRQANPNLNFDVASVPQGSGATTLRNYGDFYAFAIPRASKNQTGAYAVAQILGSETNARMLTELLGIAPVHRTLLGNSSSNPFRAIIFNSALIARGWLDPNPSASDEVFKSMVQDVTSGRARISDVLNDTIRRLELLFK